MCVQVSILFMAHAHARVRTKLHFGKRMLPSKPESEKETAPIPSVYWKALVGKSGEFTAFTDELCQQTIGTHLTLEHARHVIAGMIVGVQLNAAGDRYLIIESLPVVDTLTVFTLPWQVGSEIEITEKGGERVIHKLGFSLVKERVAGTQFDIAQNKFV